MFRGIAVLAAIGVLALAGTATAGKGGAPAKSESSISLVVVGTAAFAAASTSAHYGDQVTFDISTSETPYPYVNLKCFQNGAMVGQAWEGFYAGALADRMFTLWSPQWSGGPADCTATLNKPTKRGWQELASTSFTVSE
jgi:hypothetical protein